MNTDDASRPGSGGLLTISFLGLLFTQLLTAVNDNVFRWLVIGIGKDYVDPSRVGAVLMAGTACFVFPYLVLAAPAGYLADRFSKRSVIVGCKIAEILIMGLGVLAIWMESMVGLFGVVALMGAQSALFSPSKLGIIPEMLTAGRISAANGLFGLTTVSATVIGMGVGNWLSEATGFRGIENLGLSAAVLIGIAVTGTLLSLVIRHLPVADPLRTFPWNAPAQTVRDLGALIRNRPLLRVSLGIVFFWSVGALAQLNIDQFAAEGGALTETAKVPLLFALVLGVGGGSVLAGIWSAGRVELGILPLGACGISICAMLLFLVQGNIIDPTTAWNLGFVVACILLFVLGTSAGLFSVPLEAFMQHRSPVASRGSILAAANFLVFTGVLCSALLFAGLRAPIRAGSLDNLSPEDRGATLPAEQTARVEEAAAAFQTAWQQEDEARIEEYLPRETAAQYRATLARLLWIDFKQRRGRREFVNKDDYFARFPQHQQLVKAVYDQATDLPLLTSQQIFLLAGLFTIPVFMYIVWLIPQSSIRFLVWLASRTVYRVRVHGRENLPETGGALLVPNHVSWIDGVLLLLTSSRPIRMIVWVGNFQSRFMRWMGSMWGAILIESKPKMIARALRTAREALQNGELVCIFPEGGITRSGQLQSFKPGMMKILDGADVPVVPVYLDGLWGSIFSFERGRFFWKWPKRWPYPIQIFFGEPITHPDDVHEVRRVVQELGAKAVQQRATESASLVSNFVRQCRRRRWKSKVADSTGAELSGGSLLMRSLILRRLLRRHVLDEHETNVGVLLPPSVGGTVANVALTIDRRVACNLNYTVTAEVMNICIAQADIKHVLTSRKVMEKMAFELDAEVIYLDDLREQLTLGDKLVSAAQAHLLPAGMLTRLLAAHHTRPEDVLTIIFTSGSTGIPKGVVLTHANITTQVEAIEQVVKLSSRDVLVGILPFFHSFGFTVTLWTVLAIDVKGVYHFNPLDGRQVGKLCARHGGTILLSTPTFLRTYLRRCDKEDFATLDAVVTGAEKLPPQLADAFESKFGTRPVEGYGTTELSPLVSVNIPPSRSSGIEVDLKEGTVGLPVPGVSAKVLDLDSGEELGVGQPGMLWITGPNVMQGYLGREDLNAEVIKDGWYKTGDVALIDEGGFIQITGRESRFSKIGGEMVPHIQVEDILNELIGANEEDGLQAAVTAVPDAKKGERLVVVHTKLEKTVEQLRKGLSEAGLPNIFIPSADRFIDVKELPVLGSGKLDLKRIQQIAIERFGQEG